MVTAAITSDKRDGGNNGGPAAEMTNIKKVLPFLQGLFRRAQQGGNDPKIIVEQVLINTQRSGVLSWHEEIYAKYTDRRKSGDSQAAGPGAGSRQKSQLSTILGVLAGAIKGSNLGTAPVNQGGTKRRFTKWTQMYRTMALYASAKDRQMTLADLADTLINFLPR